jgi:NADH:coQ oxidoreductase subunit B18, putative
MGQNPSSAIEPFSLPHLRGRPNSLYESKYDPLYGFPKGRKKREMIATEEEMDSARLPYYLRDYCAHHMIKLLACRRDNNPFVHKCKHYKHMYHDCMYEE